MAATVGGRLRRMTNGAPEVAGQARRRKATLGRVGLVGKGVVYGLVGVLAVQLATGDAAQADQNGAIAWVAGQPLGKFLLVALTISLFALAIWRLVEVFTGDPVEGDEAQERIKFGASGLAYLVVAISALTATVREWSSDGGAPQGGGGQGSQQRATDTVLDWPAGRWIVGVVGLVVIAAAVYVLKHYAIDKAFAKRLRVAADHWSIRLGQFGYGARAVVYAVIGVFVVQAALAYDASEAKGLSASLQELSGKGWGQAVLWFVAIGFIAYGLYCFAESYYRRSA